MWAIQLVKDKSTLQLFDSEKQINIICREFARKNGLVIRAIVNDRMIIAPPLVISRAEVDFVVDVFRKSLDETLEEIKSRDWL
ncbi:putative aminotransferase [compost metagenome]